MAELNAIPLRYEINLPSVKQQSQELKALLQKQSEEHSALLKKQWEAERQHGANIGAIRASYVKKNVELEKQQHAELAAFRKQQAEKSFSDIKAAEDRLNAARSKGLNEVRQQIFNFEKEKRELALKSAYDENAHHQQRVKQINAELQLYRSLEKEKVGRTFSEQFKNILSSSGIGGGALGGIVGNFGGAAVGVAGIGAATIAIKEFSKWGLEAEEGAQRISIGLRSTGTAASELATRTDALISSSHTLGDRYAVNAHQLQEATGRYLEFGGTQDRLAEKQKIIIALAERVGISLDDAARYLVKGTNPELLLRLTRVGIAFDENATAEDRFNQLSKQSEKLLEGLAAKSETVEGKVNVAKNRWEEFKDTIGTSFLNVANGTINAIDSINETLDRLMGTQSAEEMRLDHLRKTGKDYTEQEVINQNALIAKLRQHENALKDDTKEQVRNNIARFQSEHPMDQGAIDALLATQDKAVSKTPDEKREALDKRLTDLHKDLDNARAVSVQASLDGDKALAKSSDENVRKIGANINKIQKLYDDTNKIAGLDSGGKGKTLEDKLQEEFTNQISINELNYKQELHQQEQFFIGKQINFEQWKKNDEANQYQKLYADLSADKEYWRKLGVVTEEGLAQERKYDGDYIDIIAKLDKLKDIERTAELDREKKFNDELHKGSEQRVNDQINMREKLRDAARKLDEEAWKEKEREAAGYKKAIDEKLSETEKSEKEITGVFETEIRKQTSAWEDSIFGKKENFATNIAKGLLKVGENRLFDAVNKAFDSKDTGEKEKIPALQKPVLYKEMKTEMLTVDSLRVGSIDNSAFSGNTFDINQNKLNNGKKFDKDYNTVLNSEEEKAFQKWKSKYAPNDSGSDYDLRGAFEEGMTPDKKNGHWSDKYKKPNHPTFSNESQYAPFGTPGHWDGEKFIPYSQDQLKIGMGTGTKDNQSSNSMSQRELNAIVGGAHPWEQLSEGTTATEAQQKENKRIRDKEALDNFIASHNSDNGSIDEARIPGSISKSLDLDYTKQNKDFFKQVGMQSIDMMKVGMYSSMVLGGLANLGGSAALDAAPSWLHSMQHLVTHGVQHAGVDFLGDTIENSGKATDQSKATEGWEGGDIPRLDLGAYQDKNTTTPDKSKATASPEQSDTAIAVKAGVKNGITELGSKAAGGGKINAADILGSLLGIGMSVASGGITKLLGLSMGGIVPQYFADGGSVSSNRSGIITFQGSPGAHKVFKPKGTDTVPSMLTPGEEVLTANDPRHRNNYMRYGSSGVSSTDMSAMHGALKESNALLKEIASQRLVTDNYGNRTGQFQNLQERMGGRF